MILVCGAVSIYSDEPVETECTDRNNPPYTYEGRSLMELIEWWVLIKKFDYLGQGVGLPILIDH
ncbi:MAG: hypothetical protein DLM61_27460 [Pseudonocardiales bacterium]|nr:MAG: hypothetical protein DLM61_27460 [Pseudonocardiales bacterium]